jgi:hypothetical protein
MIIWILTMALCDFGKFDFRMAAGIKFVKCELRAEISQCSEIKRLKIPAFSFMRLENPNPLILKCRIQLLIRI